mgnify:FL=1
MKCILLSAGQYNRKIILKFYEPVSGRIILVNDEYKNRCYVSNPEPLREMIGVSNITEIEVFDTIKDKKRNLYAVELSNPNIMNDDFRDSYSPWESDIKYYQSYLYDSDLIVGKWYSLDNGVISKLDIQSNINLENISMGGVIDTNLFKKQMNDWASLLGEDIPKIRRLAFDIEVESDGEKLPDPLVGANRVTAISFVGETIHKVFVLERSEVERGELDANTEYIFYNSEKEMLEDAFNIIESYPVILTYNGDTFDMPYLYNRGIKLGIQNIPFKMMSRNATLSLGIHIDLYGVFSNRSLKVYAFNQKYTEDGLGAVSQALLGETKTEYEGNLNDITLGILGKYCLNDSRLTYKLTTYNNELVMNLLIILCRVGNMPIDDISRMSISNWIKSMLHYAHRQRRELIPKTSDFPNIGAGTKAIIKDKKYKGAIVLDPPQGIHFGVQVMDFASLYPSIMKTRNISYETVCCPHEECKSNKVEGTEHWTCVKKQGIISLLIGSLKEVRVNHFKKLSKTAETEELRTQNDTIAQALKVFLNASYGVLGAEIFSLYYIPVAESITAVGRNIITETAGEAKQMGMNVIYGDTDSLFIKQPTKEQVENLMQKTTEKYNIDLEVDKIYRYAVFSTRKKNYFGIKMDGKADIKGLTGKKSSTPPFLKKLFNDIMDELTKVMVESDFINAKKNISTMISGTITNFDDIPLVELTFKMKINKDPNEYKGNSQHVKVGKQLPKDIEKGQVIRYIKTWTKEKVKPLELATRREVSKEKYMEAIEAVMSQVTEPMDIEFDSLTGHGKQTNLSDW